MKYQQIHKGIATVFFSAAMLVTGTAYSADASTEALTAQQRSDLATTLTARTKELAPLAMGRQFGNRGGADSSPGVDTFKDDARQAIDLYRQAADDEAALTALSFVYTYCQAVTDADEKQQCTETLQPEILGLLLEHHANNPKLLSFLFTAMGSEVGLVFIDAWYDKASANKTKVSIATMVGSTASRTFHTSASEAERNQAKQRAIKYGKALSEELATESMKFHTEEPIPMDKWKGLGVLNSVQSLYAGKVMPDPGYPKLNGEMDNYKNYRGKVVLVDFWATWCVPCVASMPHIKELREELAGQPFEVISVSTDNDADTVIEFQEDDVDMPWVNWLDTPNTQRYFGMGLFGLPTYFVLDTDGTILYRGSRFDDKVTAMVKEALAKLKK